MTDKRSIKFGVLYKSILGTIGLFLFIWHLSEVIGDRLFVKQNISLAKKVAFFRSENWDKEATFLLESSNPHYYEIEKSLREAIRRNPYNPFYWNKLAKMIALTRNSKNIETTECYIQAIRLAPYHAPFYIDAAIFEITFNNLQGANQFLQKAVHLEPRTSKSYFLLAIVHYKQGDLKSAKDNLKIALDNQNLYKNKTVKTPYSDYLFDMNVDDANRLSLILNKRITL